MGRSTRALAVAVAAAASMGIGASTASAHITICDHGSETHSHSSSTAFVTNTWVKTWQGYEGSAFVHKHQYREYWSYPHTGQTLTKYTWKYC